MLASGGLSAGFIVSVLGPFLNGLVLKWVM